MTLGTAWAISQGVLRTADGMELPLERTVVRASLHGPVAKVTVEQRFRNSRSETIEAVYAFPLPPEASVEHMEFRLADRVVKGVVKEKAQARADYERARAEGRSATLLEQDQPTVFTLSVSQVLPGETLHVTLRYQEVLRFDDGLWRFVFPLVAPERYEVLPTGPRVPTGTRLADVAAEIEVHGLSDEEAASLACKTHPVQIEAQGSVHKVLLQPREGEQVPNRDLVITWKAAARGVRPVVHFESQPEGAGTMLMVLTPPEASEPEPPREGMKALQCGNCGGPMTDVGAIQQIPGLGPVYPCKFCGAILTPSSEGRITRANRARDVLVLVDRSASMRGWMPQIRRAVQTLIRSLCPGDAIQVIAFDHDQVAFEGDGKSYVTLSPEVAARIDTFLSTLAPRGGTELERALEAAGAMKGREGSSRPVVLITDAAVGNEGRLLRRIPELLPADQGRRLFVLGMGATLDRRFLEKMARTGGGTSDALAPGEEAEPVLERFGRRIREGGPILTGISLSFEGVQPTDVYPSPLPDLYGGEPITLLGRIDALRGGKLVLTAATADGRPFRQELLLQPPAEETPGLLRLWARQRIEALLELSQKDASNKKRIEGQVTKLALEHQLMSPFTSLVAEDSRVRRNTSKQPERVEIPRAEIEADRDLSPPSRPFEESPALPSSMEGALSDLHSEDDMDGSLADEEAPVTRGGMRRERRAEARGRSGSFGKAAKMESASVSAADEEPTGSVFLSLDSLGAPAPAAPPASMAGAPARPRPAVSAPSPALPGAPMSKDVAEAMREAAMRRTHAILPPPPSVVPQHERAAKRSRVGLLGAAMAVGGAIAGGLAGLFGGDGEKEEAKPTETPPRPTGAPEPTKPAPRPKPTPGPVPTRNPPAPPRPAPPDKSIEASDSESYSPAELSFIQSRTSGELDLVFLVDETGSMGAYIEQVKARLSQLIAVLSRSPLCRSLRIGLVTYRDHPPQDHTYPSRVVPLTADLASLQQEVNQMQASGGGDGPESVTDGLYELVRLDWRPNAARTVVWFGDAPPHGVVPHGDGFPQGCPCGHHWFTQAESCREMGIAVHAVGCVPGIHGFVGAEAVFRLVASTARGLYLPLSDAELLVPLIVAAAYTELDKQRLDERLADLVAENREKLARTDEPERIRWLTEQMSQRGVQPRSLAYDPARRDISPMRFRPLSEADVASSLDRLRLADRV